MTDNIKHKEEDNLTDEPPKQVINQPKAINDLPIITMEVIFKNLSREDLDKCQQVCRAWYHFIEDAGKRLPQRRALNIDFMQDQNKDVFIMNKKRKGYRIDEGFIRKRPNFFGFKNSIIIILYEIILSDTNLMDKYQRIYDVFGNLIPVDDYMLGIFFDWSLDVYNNARQAISRFINAPKIRVLMFSEMFRIIIDHYESSSAGKIPDDILDFGLNVVEIRVVGYPPMRSNFNRKAFFDCRFIKRPELISLSFSMNYDRFLELFGVIDFYDSSDPKFFRIVKLYLNQNLDGFELPSQHRFVPMGTSTERSYRLKHPRNKCSLVLVIEKNSMEFKLEAE